MRAGGGRIQVSVVIPSYNRLDALPETLAALSRQTLDASAFEVLVADDGSSDGTVEWLRHHRGDFPFTLEWIEQARGGPGAARNRGARAAHHGLLLFWDSDMIAAPDLLQVHMSRHNTGEQMLVSGARRPWPPACQSAFSRITVLSGPRDHLGDGRPTIFEVLSSNLSIRRDLFLQLGGFDESLWAYEDLDFAYRAQQAGVLLVFSHEAFGYHNHPQTLEQACGHQRAYQVHAASFLSRYPELKGQVRYLVDKAPADLRHDSPGLILRKGMRRLIASPVVLRGLVAWVHFLERWWPQPKVLSFFYWKVVSSYQYLGYREGLEKLRGTQRRDLRLHTW